MKKLGVISYLLLFLLGLDVQAQTVNPPGGNVIIPSGGGTIATRDWVEQFIFNRLGELGLSNCNMTVNSIQEDPVEHSLSFAIGNPIQDVTTYKVEIKKGTASWFYTSIPYQTGQRLTISGIQATGTVLITVSPTGRPSCYASATFTLSGDGGGEISPCTSGPTITSISQITDTTLVAAYTGTGVSSIRYKILNTSGTQVHTATVNPPGSIVGLSFPRLVPGAYTLVFEGLNCTGSSTLGFAVSSPLAACIRGPSIFSVNSITSTGATVTFDGLGVSGLAWQIRDGATLIKSGSLNPTSSTFNISYFLGNGTYRLRLLGTNCSGSSETDFTISGGTGGDQTLATGWKYIGQTDTTFLKISVAGGPGAWLITDTAPFTPAAGYEFRYTINDVIVKGSKLTSYAYNSNGVLDVKKWSVKPAVPDNMYNWTVESYGSADNGQSFSTRGDVGGQSIIFFQADDTVPGLTWLDTTPSWYQGDHTVSWPTRAPNMNLPGDKYMMFSFKLAGVDQNLRQSKGETFTPDHTDITKRIGIVANLAEAGIPSPSATRDQIRTAADAWPLYGSQAFQWHEGGNNFPQLSTGERYFIERLRERYVATGRANYVLMAGYGSYDYVTTQIWPNPSNSVNPNSLRWRYTGSKQDLISNDPYFAHFNGYNNAINTKNYGTNPGLMGSEIIRVAKLQSIKKAGFKAIMFGWGMIEILAQNAWVKGFGWQTSYPGGKVVIQQNLSQVPFYDAVLNGFNSMWYGDGFWAWDGDGPRNTDPTTIGPTYEAKETTLIGGATVTTGGSSAYKPQPDSGLDGLYIGAALYNQCVETEGGTQFFATFTVGGNTYTAEPDGSDPLTAYSQQRGLTSVRTKDGKATIVYFNPWAGNSWQDFSVNVYGTPYTGKVFGKGLFVANVSLGGLAACPSGPTFFNGNGQAVFETSATGTRITFDAVGVSKIGWTVKDNGANFDSGEITPSSSTPYINFSSTYQAGHTYTMTIQGASCTSVPSTYSFTVPNQNAPPSGQVDATLIAQHYVGISNPNGTVANHLAILDYANTHGYNANGVVFDIKDVEKDSDWNIANWNAYDHTSPTAGSHNFDNVVRQYYLSGKKLRVMLPLGRSWNGLNGEQSNQTSFWSPSDSHLRLDGTPTYRKATGPVPNDAAPSLATSAVRNYSNGLVYRFFKRYLAAINDGTILCVGIGTEANAEAQMPIDFQDEDGFQINGSNPRGGLTNPRGDFNTASISRFKTIFPEYAGASNSDIANADVSTDLGMKFWWHEADLLRETEWAAIDYMKANVPGLTRSRFWAIDAGSHADNLSTVRRTFNVQSRSARPEYVLIKTNDNPAASFAVDYAASAARKINAIPFWEPTPADQGGTSGFILEKDFTISRSIRGKNQGFSFSLLVAANNDITYVIAQGAGIIGLPAPIVPTSTVNLTLYLKDILTKGQNTYIDDQWKAVRTASGKEFVNFTIIDNVKPN